MALSKAVLMPATGVALSYWRITAVEVLHDPVNAIGVWLAGYVNVEARQAGAQPVDRRWFRFGVADLPGVDLHQVATAQIYDAIKVRLAAVPAERGLASRSPEAAGSSTAGQAPSDILAGAVDA